MGKTFLISCALNYCNWIVSIPLCTCKKFYEIELSLHNIQITVPICNWLIKYHVSALFGHHQAYRKMALIGIANECTLTPSFCKPDSGQTRPKHVAYLTSYKLQLLFVCCVKRVQCNKICLNYWSA